jgi:hypothetical protein
MPVPQKLNAVVGRASYPFKIKKKPQKNEIKLVRSKDFSPD